MVLWWNINVYYTLCVSKYIWNYGELSMFIVYYVCPSIYVIMVSHQCALYIMYVQIYVELWGIISVYCTLCMSKYICYYGKSSMCIIYYICPNIYGIMENHQCVLYIMYDSPYCHIHLDITLYRNACILQLTSCWWNFMARNMSKNFCEIKVMTKVNFVGFNCTIIQFLE